MQTFLKYQKSLKILCNPVMEGKKFTNDYKIDITHTKKYRRNTF